ncbi:MAG: flagellar biosynthesis anti-sigma factor FlgM [Acidobacteriia bacterium]|nr:flagellar biosynthesis anti-sigma factor FlgM [Terriglobia bacterium]
MRVDDRNLNGAAGVQTGRTPESQGADRTGPASGAQISESQGGDRVEISGTAGNVAQALGAGSAQRAQHVQKLAADYRSGNYTVNSLATSRAIVQDALERKDGAR